MVMSGAWSVVDESTVSEWSLLDRPDGGEDVSRGGDSNNTLARMEVSELVVDGNVCSTDMWVVVGLRSVRLEECLHSLDATSHLISATGVNGGEGEDDLFACVKYEAIFHDEDDLPYT